MPKETRTSRVRAPKRPRSSLPSAICSCRGVGSFHITCRSKRANSSLAPSGCPCLRLCPNPALAPAHSHLATDGFRRTGGWWKSACALHTGSHGDCLNIRTPPGAARDPLASLRLAACFPSATSVALTQLHDAQRQSQRARLATRKWQVIDCARTRQDHRRCLVAYRWRAALGSCCRAPAPACHRPTCWPAAKPPCRP